MHPQIPAGLLPALNDRAERVRARLDALTVMPPVDPAELYRVALISEFFLGVLERQPDILAARLADAAPFAPPADAAGVISGTASEAQTMRWLRRTRDVEQARIVWRSVLGLDTVEDTLQSTSGLADSLVALAVEQATASTRQIIGSRIFGESEPPPLLVLGMGKLGGGELNFSSDIDLVFLYPDEALDPGTAQPYFLRLAQTLIRLLDERTGDGFVYRTDARLRPFGASGPLAIGLSAFESYLVTSARDWERYAYVKARLLNAPEYAPSIFDEFLDRYVYRKYLDFGVIDSLRQLKQLIRREVARKEMHDDVKLGAGGIREIEFIVQSHQLVRGGREPALRNRSLLTVLPGLGDERLLGPQTVAELRSAYLHLRKIENFIQMLEDRQTHRLPESEEKRARLCLAAGYPSWEDFLAAHQLQLGCVERAFDLVVAEVEVEGTEADFATRWLQGSLPEPAPGADAGPVSAALNALRDGPVFARMDELSRERLARLLGQLLARYGEDEQAVQLLERILPIIISICRRSAYLALLAEHPSALERLMVIARRSARLCQQIAAQPLLLDELLDPRVFEQPPTQEELRLLLAQYVERAPKDDPEASLDVLRQFHSAAVFRVAVADTLGQLPLMQVSDRLTDIAELVVNAALTNAGTELAERYGQPIDPLTGEACGFAVIAYGKFGGLELGYGSDLDLVFLHNSEGSSGQTNGVRPIANDIFFARLAQKLIHHLSVQTGAGRLYEIDTRLRPSGASGLLVATLRSFSIYQQKSAWTWEHQALLRSRPVAGDPGLQQAFSELRMQILTGNVRHDTLRQDVLEMRMKMRDNLSKSAVGTFDLKQDAGGLADIEFLVDYLVLAHADAHPELARYPDKVRQLEMLSRIGIISAADELQLRSAYLAIRAAVHDLALDAAGRVVDDQVLVEPRAGVTAIWARIFA